MTEASTQDEDDLSPRERQLMYLALASLATSLKVLGDSQRAMIARLDASHEAHKNRRRHHAHTMRILRQALAIGEAKRCEAKGSVAGGPEASAAENSAGSSKAIAVEGPRARVSGRVRRKRGRSRSAAG
jgi:hypothetical protein